MPKPSRRPHPRSRRRPAPLRPLVAACLIVKDEEAVIARCLESVQPFVDEIVVHDTGSTDATVEICESKGARVIRGGWRDDFSWARNVAIEAARAEWVLIIDADEVLEATNFEGLRTVLRQGRVDGYRAQVNNVSDFTGSVSVSHSSIRLFRQRLFRYAGRIHEQVVSIAPHRVSFDAGEIFELTHWGYLPEVMAAKQKAERNIKLAEASRDDEEHDKSILETARAYSLGNKTEQCLAEAERVRWSEDLEIREQALQLGVQMLVRQERYDDALQWIDELVALDRPSGLTVYVHGFTLVRLERWEEALEVLSAGHDQAAAMALGVNHSTAASDLLRSLALIALGRHEEGVDLLVEVARTGPIDVWGELLKALYARGEMHRAVEVFVGQDLEETSRRLRGILAQLLALPIEVGDAFAEALWAAHPGDAHALAFVAMAGQRLPVERAITWSARAREAGQEPSCPLMRQVHELALTPTQRVTAAAVLLDMHEDARAVDGMARAARDLSDSDVLEALYTVGEVAPKALEPFVMGVVTSQERALVMARALTALHAEEQAAAVLRMGLEVPAERPGATPQLQLMLEELEAVGG